MLSLSCSCYLCCSSLLFVVVAVVVAVVVVAVDLLQLLLVLSFVGLMSVVYALMSVVCRCWYRCCCDAALL